MSAPSDQAHACTSQQAPANTAEQRQAEASCSTQSTEWSQQEIHFMQLALRQADNARIRGEVPIGCVIVRDGEVIGEGFNLTNETRNGTRHAEFQAIDAVLQRHGGDLAAAELRRSQLYVTCEPCVMCAGALALVGVGRVYFGCANDKFGGCGSILPLHEWGCGDCGGQEQSSTMQGRGYEIRGGLFKQEAIRLLQEFYLAGNPNAPRPHRTLLPRDENGQVLQPANGEARAAVDSIDLAEPLQQRE